MIGFIEAYQYNCEATEYQTRHRLWGYIGYLEIASMYIERYQE
jgi:hypothetical protein